MQRLKTPISGGGDGARDDTLNLLCLDGGGVRGLSSLYILKAMMENLDPDHPPLPCDYFDMIGGTSTGGLIAIMLGRLEMTVDECIEEYKRLSPAIFTKVHHRVTVAGRTQGRFDHKALEDGIKDLLKRRKVKEDELFKENSNGLGRKCKTFVLATSQKMSKTVVISSYFNRRRGNDLRNVAQIWQVARATSAATTFFEPVTFGGETFLDGGTGANNPVEFLWLEAADLFRDRRDETWSLDRGLTCLVSIGTGKPLVKAFGGSLLKNEVGDALVAIATDTEQTANIFQTHHTQLFQEHRAFRFNVISGLEEVGLEEKEKFEQITAATRNYIMQEDTFQSMQHCVEILSRREWFQHIVQMLASFRTPDMDDSPPGDMTTYIPHTTAYVEWFKSGGILFYEKPSKLDAGDIPSTDAAASVIRYMLDKEQRIVDSSALVLYYLCKSPRNIEIDAPVIRGKSGPSRARKKTKLDESSLTSTHAVLCSLILQTLSQIFDSLGGRRDRFRQYLMQEIDHHVLQLVPSNFQSEGTDLKGLLIFFNGLVGKRQLVVGIDNGDGLEESSWTHTDPVLLNELVLRSRRSQTYLVLGGWTRSNQVTAFDGIRVSDAIECQECLGSLNLDRREERRNEVVKPEPGTTDWLWEHREYGKWRNQAAGILWIEGKPGSGKSVLAKSILEQGLPKLSSASKDGIICDWFYTTRGGDLLMAHRSLMRSILFQLLTQRPSLFHHFADEYRAAPPGTSEWVQVDSLKRILTSIATSGQHAICVVDAIDESEDEDQAEIQRKDVIQYFRSLTVDTSVSRMKFIILSRPTSDIEEEFWKLNVGKEISHIIMEVENAKAIKLVADAGILLIRQALHPLQTPFAGRSLSKVPQGLDPDDEDHFCADTRSFLVKNAQGVILWVSVVIKSLISSIELSRSTFPELRQEMEGLPVDIDRLYLRIITSLLAKLDDKGKAKARAALMWVSFANTLGPFNLVQLHEALAIPHSVQEGLEYPVSGNSDPMIYNQQRFKYWVEFRLYLRKLCGPLIETIREGEFSGGLGIKEGEIHNIRGTTLVQVLHRTAKDFLEGSGAPAAIAFTHRDAAEMVEEQVDTYLALAFPRPSEESRYFPLRSGVKHQGDLQNMYSKMASYLNRRGLYTSELASSVNGGRNHLEIAMSAKRVYHQHSIVHQVPYFSEWFRGTCDTLGVAATLCMDATCRDGLLVTTEIILRTMRRHRTWSHDSFNVDTNCFWYQLPHIALYWAVHFRLHEEARKLAAMARANPYDPPHYLWKRQWTEIGGQKLQVSPLELCAAKAGDELLLELMMQGADACPDFEELLHAETGKIDCCLECQNQRPITSLRGLKSNLRQTWQAIGGRSGEHSDAVTQKIDSLVLQAQASVAKPNINRLESAQKLINLVRECKASKDKSAVPTATDDHINVLNLVIRYIRVTSFGYRQLTKFFERDKSFRPAWSAARQTYRRFQSDEREPKRDGWDMLITALHETGNFPLTLGLPEVEI